MSVYKELFKFAETVESKSNKIYNDAADYGVKIFDLKSSEIQQLNSLKEMYDGEIKTQKYSTGATQTITIKGMNEWGRGEDVIFTFTYVAVRSKEFKGYLSVDVKHKTNYRRSANWDY